MCEVNREASQRIQSIQVLDNLSHFCMLHPACLCQLVFVSYFLLVRDLISLVFVLICFFFYGCIDSK